MYGLVLKEKINFNQLLPILLYFILILLGITQSLVNGDYYSSIKALSGNQGINGYIVHILIISSGLLIFSYNKYEIFDFQSAKKINLFIFTGFLITLGLGGINFEIPPSFEFEYASDEGGGKSEYSAGISKVFGFGALTSMYLTANSSQIGQRIFYSLTAIVFLALSILGGSRGDALGVLIIGLIYILSIRPLGFTFYALLMLGILSFFISDWVWIEDLVFISRLLVILDGDYGLRDVLFSQSLSILTVKPSCALFGCGFGFFQYFYGYDISLYPHNIFLESLIVFGIPITIIYFLLSFYGLFLYFKRINKLDLFILFYFFNLIIIFKSGSLFNDWFFTVSSIYLVSIALIKFANVFKQLTFRDNHQA